MKQVFLFASAVFVFYSCSHDPEKKTKADSAVPVHTIEVTEPNLLNYTDAAGLRQGHWIITGKMIQDADYAPDAKAEEGLYLNGKKEGDWRTYDANGNVKSVDHFVNDQRTGE